VTTLEKLMFLRGVELFRDFSVEDLALISEISRELPLAAGEVLYEVGKPAERLMVLAQGTVSLFIEDGAEFTLISMLGAGDTLGEVALFDGKGHPTSARVEEDGRALGLEREETLGLIREYPSLAIGFLNRLAGSIRDLQGRVQLLEREMTSRM
jgi:CRP-like cAMP-binding protein